MEKIDLTKQYKTYYTAKAAPELVQIEKAQYVSIEGAGDPNGADFAEKIQALYATAYAIKFNYKAQQKDFAVPKLEGLWWFDESQYGGLTMEEAPVKIPREVWQYRLLLRMPDFVGAADVESAKRTVISKKRIAVAHSVGIFEMTEGRAVQMLHKGAFDREPETLKRMALFMQENNLHRNGLHHEIYLSDFRRTSPEKLKTILREPVK